MPAKSPAQQRLMAAALHGATFPKAKDVRASMTTPQLRAYAQGPSVGEAIGPATPPARPVPPTPTPKPRLRPKGY
jgi:hypothetical protein